MMFTFNIRSKWFVDLQRMPINSLPYRAYNMLADGSKAKGRPRKIWRDYIKDTLQQYDLTINDATRYASARILKRPHIKRPDSGEQQPSRSPVTE
jgi:hypothetical protein